MYSIKKDNQMNLDIGCGRTPIEGYTGVDIVAEVNPDIVAPMWKIPVPDDSVDRIFSTHALEHVEKKMIVPTLKEWHRILKPGANAEIQVPSLEWCCRNWLKYKTNDWHMDVLFGNQEHEGEFHKSGFTVEIMQSYLEQAGLVMDGWDTIWSHEQDTLCFFARKP